MTLPGGVMLLDQSHVSYLAAHGLGRLATVAPGGGPQNKPVGYRYNAELGTIDIGGLSLERSAKYRNIAANPLVSFVVDDADGDGEGAEAMRFIEVRGRAEQAPAGRDGGPVIRLRPSRVVSWNIPGHAGLHTAGPLPAGTAPGDPASGDLASGDPGPGGTAPVNGTAPAGDASPASAGAGSAGERPFLDLGDGAAIEAARAAESLAAELQAGFDAGDADVSNRHFAGDIVWGSPFGATVTGFEELHAIHTALKKQGRGGPASRFEVVQVLAPAPGVAVAQVKRTALAGDGGPAPVTGDLTGPFSEMALYVLVRRGGAWWLAAGQNTPLLPPPPAAG
jgi:PPOX class F420-dependent enzyme/OxyR family protein